MRWYVFGGATPLGFLMIAAGCVSCGGTRFGGGVHFVYAEKLREVTGTASE